MAKIAKIDAALCDRRPTCPAMRLCPQKAIFQKKEGGFHERGLSVVDKSKCTGCLICANYCPRNAITAVAV